MTGDTIAGIVAVGSVAVIAAGFALYWRQRLRFTGGADPVTFCALRAWRGPLGLGWRQGFVRLREDELSWRRRLTFRQEPYATYARSSLTFVRRTRPDWQSFLWISACDVVTLGSPQGTLDLALFPHDVDLLLDWLGTSAERPKARLKPGVRVALYLVWLVALPVLYWSFNGQPWLVPFIGIGVVVVSGAGAVVVEFLRRRRRIAQALEDDFIATARDVFSFLQDFGFEDAYVSRLPWRAVVVSTGKAGRFVAIGVDRREEKLDLEFGWSNDDKPSRLRDVLAQAGHPDADRITRYTGADGPLRAALEANAHALRLWGRPFLIAEASPSAVHVERS